MPPALQRVTFESTTQIPVDLGTGNDGSIIIGGDFRECWVGIRMQAMVEVLRELYAANYQHGFMGRCGPTCNSRTQRHSVR